MSNPPIRTVVPAHRFLEEFRGTDSADGEEGLCGYHHSIDPDGSGEFCSEVFSHSVHHGVDYDEQLV